MLSRKYILIFDTPGIRSYLLFYLPVMIPEPASGFYRKLLPALILLCNGIAMGLPVLAQHPLSLPSYYYEINIGAQSHFGPFDKQAEISGGYDSLFYDSVRHYKPGFKTTIPVEVVIGYYRPRGFRLEGRLGYFQQDIGLIRLNSEEEFHLAYAPTLSLNFSAMLFLTNSPEKIPYGFFAGFSAGCIYPLQYIVDPGVKTDYGIERIQVRPQLHLSLEGVWNARLTKQGLYFTLKLASDLPSLLAGSTGRFHMDDTAGYTVNSHPVKMYSFRISGGIGYTFRR